jgi:hypothetical protein
VDTKAIELLRTIGREIATQDNAATSEPLFADNTLWYEKEEGHEATDPEVLERLEQYRNGELTVEEDAELLSKYGYTGYIDTKEFVTLCFTRKGAEDYLAINGHNLREPFIYVLSAWRNREMIGLRNLMLEIAGGQQ